ncbi:MAG: hypothetical protein M1423_04760 [Acidobacteria bacterium]|nr:hypothetical protein [Acidobacteriota bacterium]
MGEMGLAALAARCVKAKALYDQFGELSFRGNIDIANALKADGLFTEAAAFFDASYQLNTASRDALLAKLLAVIASGGDCAEADLEALKKLDDGFYRFARTRSLMQKGTTDASELLSVLRNGFETFYTGSSADSLFITLALPLVSPPHSSINSSRSDIIPRRLYFYWDKNPPPEVLANIEYHQRLGIFDVLHYTKEAAIEFLDSYYGRPTRDLFLTMGHPSAESDFFRFHVINTFGGYYLDTDEKIISESLFFEEFGGSYETVCVISGSGPIHSAFFGAVKQSPIMLECILSLIYNSFANKDLSLWLKTGPGPITRAIARSLFRSLFCGVRLPSMRVFPPEVFPRVFGAVPMPYRDDARDWRVFEAQRN